MKHRSEKLNRVIQTAFWTVPDHYFPKITLVGNASAKIFAADGARRIIYAIPPAAATIVGPRYVLESDPPLVKWSDTMFSDYGAFCGMSQSYLRNAVPGNASVSDRYLQDGRILAYRHGRSGAFGPAGAYRMNAVFFDGHAETLDDFSASNPGLWLPKGTIFWNPTHGATGPVRAGLKVLWADYQKRSLPGNWGTGTYFVIP